MLGKILKALAAALVVFLGYVAIQPADYKVTRELTLNASPAVIFPHVNHSKKANEWMPWRQVDPNLQMNYSGPEAGVGSKSSWDSTGQMGTGEALVVESVLNQIVKTQLTYTKPMQMSQLSEISLIPTASGTTVRWSVAGKNNFMGRLMCTFFNMDKMVGEMFEKGLAQLKLIAESPKRSK